MPRRRRPTTLPALLASLVLALAATGTLHAEGLTLPGLDGGKLDTAQLEQGPAIVVVWASWSPRCRDVVTRVNALARKWSPRARVVTVVFQEEGETVREFLAGKGMRPPVYLDSAGAFAKKYGVTTLPGLLIFRRGQADFRGQLPVNPDPVIERALE
jgi:thiol-disulfide isomerase/thioredoxin